MKKIILSIVALVAILWVAMFVTDTKVLVNEITPGESHQLCASVEQSAKAKGKKEGSFEYLLEIADSCANVGEWECTYFNGRSLIAKNYQSYVDACPNLL